MFNDSLSCRLTENNFSECSVITDGVYLNLTTMLDYFFLKGFDFHIDIQKDCLQGGMLMSLSFNLVTKKVHFYLCFQDFHCIAE